MSNCVHLWYNYKYCLYVCRSRGARHDMERSITVKYSKPFINHVFTMLFGHQKAHQYDRCMRLNDYHGLYSN